MNNRRIIDFPISVPVGPEEDPTQPYDLFSELDDAADADAAAANQEPTIELAEPKDEKVAVGGLARALQPVPDLPEAPADGIETSVERDDDPYAELGGKGSIQDRADRTAESLKRRLSPTEYRILPLIDDEATDADSSTLPQEAIYYPDSERVDVRATQLARLDAVVALLESPEMNKIPRSREARRAAARGMDDTTVGLRTLFMQAYGCGYLESRSSTRSQKEAHVYARLLTRFETFYSSYAGSGERAKEKRQVATGLLEHRKRQLLQSAARSA